jgi:signal transduction histidine kinase
VPLGSAQGDSLHAQGEGWRWNRGQYDLRGVALDPRATLARVTEWLDRRAALLPGDQLELVTSPAASLPTLRLASPRLDDATRALTDAFWWKSALLALTALLGLSVVLLARLAERREQATLTLQREFIATVSHELRTPLAAIRVLAETLERKLAATPAAKDYPQRLVSAVDGLGFLVENILSFNRIEAGRLEPKRERFSLAALEQLLREDVALMVERPVSLDCAGLDALGSVEVDVALLRVLVLNLLRNTWKYAQAESRPGGPTFRVRGRAEGGSVVLTFTDDGPGIPADARERVFEPFHRQPGVDATIRGSGLGLALARRIARLHGGELRISHASSDGTTFELTLPRPRADRPH